MEIEVDGHFLRQIILQYETKYPEPYMPVYLFGNHDKMRLFSKIGGDIRKAKLSGHVPIHNTWCACDLLW